MHDRMIVSETARSGVASAVLDSLAIHTRRLGARVKPLMKTYGPTLVVMVVVGLLALFAPDTASAQGGNVWQSLDNVNSNAQNTLLKAMVTVGILMILVGAWMWKQEKGGAVPVLLLGLCLIVVGGLTASNVLSGIGANGAGAGGGGF
ncbi:MAG: hypothetical protein ACR2M1_04295 [Gemmatimonadaceae bacterium]